MSKVLAMFPGQGSQYVGMGRELLNEFPSVKVLFEEAADAARINIRKLCIDGPEDELKLTANTQPCILTVSVAVWKVLRDETGIEPAYYAGHSLGEYSAVVAAGKLSLGRAAFLVRRRGEAMQQAVPAGIGAMAAVMNVPAEDLKTRCEKINKKTNVVEVVNYNSPQQLVVAGHKKAVDELCAGLETDGLKFVMLPVSAPFHSSLMKPARDVMEPLLKESEFLTTDKEIIANVTGKVELDYNPSHLARQIDGAVLWTQSMETAAQLGCDTYVEIGPGRVLFGLGRRIVPKTSKIMHTDEIVKAIADLRA
jgi:[acyl-carrier-protein] S-malonyltransferase